MRYISVLFFLVFFVAALLFFNQNHEILTQTMTIKFELLKNHWETSPLETYLVVLMAFALGAVLTTVYFFFEKIRLSSAARSYKKAADKLEAEVKDLRAKLEEQKAPKLEATTFAPVAASDASGDDSEKSGA